METFEPEGKAVGVGEMEEVEVGVKVGEEEGVRVRAGVEEAEWHKEGIHVGVKLGEGVDVARGKELADTVTPGEVVGVLRSGLVVRVCL